MVYLDLNKYLFIRSDLILVEEYIDFFYKCCVDGCVSNGEILIWGIFDSYYYFIKLECFVDYIFFLNLYKFI